MKNRQFLLIGILTLVFAAVCFAVCVDRPEKNSEQVSAETAEEDQESPEQTGTEKEEEAGGQEEKQKALAESVRMHRLEWELEELLEGADGNWSVYIKNLDTDRTIVLNDQKMYAASLIKLFVMESVYENMELLEQNDSRYSGSMDKSREKIAGLLENMIQASDNEAYNELIRLHSENRSFSEGCRYIENDLETGSYENTGIFHTLMPSESEPEYIADAQNTTCAEDCGKLLESVYRRTCVSAEASEEMLDFLLRQETVYKIPSGVPDGVRVANKTGETDEVEHDAAIVFGEKIDYILCVMSSDFQEQDTAVDIIRQISAAVYEALNGQDAGLS